MEEQNNNEQQPSPYRTKQKYVYELWRHLHNRFHSIMYQKKSSNSNNTGQEEKQLGFEQLKIFLSNQTVIKLTSSFYTVLTSFVNQTPIKKNALKHKQKNSQEIKHARIILSALMVVKSPSDIFDIQDVKDLDLASEICYKNGKTLISTIVDSQPNSMQDVSRLKCEKMLSIINQFIDSFLNWQTDDVQKILSSLLSYYEEWKRSYNVVIKSSMNESQKKKILNTIKINMKIAKNRIQKIVGAEIMKEKCIIIDDKIANEPILIAPKSSIPAVQSANENSQNGKTMGSAANGKMLLMFADAVNSPSVENDDESELSLEQKLAAKGIPINIKTGTNLVKSTNNNNNNRSASDDRFIENVDGKKVLNLDSIVMEEASKKYWNDFGDEIEQQKFRRLFQLLAELLGRLKKISPAKEHKNLDDLLDVQFLQQTIDSGLIDGQAFFGIFYGIWQQIKSLQAPAEDDEWQIWHDGILEQMQANETTWSELLPTVFNMFFVKLDRIERVVEQVKQMKK